MGEFNFVFASIARVAATMGYAFTRGNKQVDVVNIPEASSSSSSHSMDMETQPSVPASENSKNDSPKAVEIFPAQCQSTPGTSRRDSTSLKRKVPHDGFDEAAATLEYPWNLANLYPNKRSRTPPNSEKTRQTAPLPSPKRLNYVMREVSDTVLHNSTERSPPTTELQGPAAGADAGSEIPGDSGEGIDLGSVSADTPALELPSASSSPPTNDATACPVPPSSPKAAVELMRAQTPIPASAPATPPPALASLPVTRPSTPVRAFGQSSSIFGATTPARFGASPSFASSGFGSTSSKGFAAFAGSTSPFAVSRTSKSASNANATLGLQNSWTQSFAIEQQTETEPSHVDREKDEDHAIVKAKSLVLMDGADVKEKSAPVTGEELEIVQSELRGLKLFMKRGDKPFASGMVGVAKILKEKKSGAERLLFRREPLWQVSMNVKLNSTVRCTYEKEENALRLVLKEPTSTSEGAPLEVVVYALKPGRTCPKSDLQSLADDLVQRLQAHVAPLDGLEKAPIKVTSA